MPQQQQHIKLMPAKFPPKETPVAAHAFEQYYSMGEERSLRLLADKTGTKLSQLGVWSSAHKWQKRVIERDQAEMARKRRKRDADIEKMNEEHAAWGKDMAALAMKQCQDLIKAKAMNAQAAVLLFKYATDLQRLAMGTATERQEITGKDGEPIIPAGQYVPLPIRDATAEQLQQLRELAESMQANEG